MADPIAPTVLAVAGTLGGAAISGAIAASVARRAERRADRQVESGLANTRRDERKLAYVSYVTELAAVSDGTEWVPPHPPTAQDLKELRRRLRPARSALSLVAPSAILAEAEVHRFALAVFESKLRTGSALEQDVHELHVRLRGDRIEWLMASDLEGTRPEDLQREQEQRLAAALEGVDL